MCSCSHQCFPTRLSHSGTAMVASESCPCGVPNRPYRAQHRAMAQFTGICSMNERENEASKQVLSSCGAYLGDAGTVLTTCGRRSCADCRAGAFSLAMITDFSCQPVHLQSKTGTGFGSWDFEKDGLEGRARALTDA